MLIGDRDRTALPVGAVMRPVLHPEPGISGRERDADAQAVPRSALTVVASGVIWLNVVADPWPNANGAEVTTVPAFAENTTAISCLGVPGSTTIVEPVPNAVPAEFTVRTLPPG